MTPGWENESRLAGKLEQGSIRCVVIHLRARGPPPPEYYGLPVGHKGGPHGDLAVGDVLAGLACYRLQPLPRGQEPQRMPQGPNWSCVGFLGSVMRKR